MSNDCGSQDVSTEFATFAGRPDVLAVTAVATAVGADGCHLAVRTTGDIVTLGGQLKQVHLTAVLLSTSIVLVFATAASAGQQHDGTPLVSAVRSQSGNQQSNVPAEARQAEDAAERTARRFRIGLEGGVGLDPELIMFGAHGAFGPLFTRNIEFRPGVEFGIGEVTTTFGVNLDLLYTLPGGPRGAGWTPYIGAGPNFALSHRGIDADELDDDRNRFDFSDTDFEGGVNFIAGARRHNGMFLEMKATAYGVSNVRLLVGFNF